jgi:hypothetical protein
MGRWANEAFVLIRDFHLLFASMYHRRSAINEHLMFGVGTLVAFQRALEYDAFYC